MLDIALGEYFMGNDSCTANIISDDENDSERKD